MKKQLFFILVAVMLLSGCNKEKVKQDISDTAIKENFMYSLFQKVICIDPGNTLPQCPHPTATPNP